MVKRIYLCCNESFSGFESPKMQIKPHISISVFHVADLVRLAIIQLELQPFGLVWQCQQRDEQSVYIIEWLRRIQHIFLPEAEKVRPG